MIIEATDKKMIDASSEINDVLSVISNYTIKLSNTSMLADSIEHIWTEPSLRLRNFLEVHPENLADEQDIRNRIEGWRMKQSAVPMPHQGQTPVDKMIVSILYYES
jgi:hypothetical protein